MTFPAHNSYHQGGLRRFSGNASMPVRGFSLTGPFVSRLGGDSSAIFCFGNSQAASLSLFRDGDISSCPNDGLGLLNNWSSQEPRLDLDLLLFIVRLA
jgi:hypothetical protein